MPTATDREHHPSGAPVSRPAREHANQRASAPPSPEQVDRLARSGLALPPEIRIDGELRRVSKHRVPTIYALGQEQGPRFDARVRGVAGLEVMEPHRGMFPGTVRAPEAFEQIGLRFHPPQAGPIGGTLELVLNDDASRTVGIPIVGEVVDPSPEPLPLPAVEPQLRALPAQVDLGEQIVGSKHWFTLGHTAISSGDQRDARVMAWIEEPARQSRKDDIPGLEMPSTHEAFSVDYQSQPLDSNHRAVPVRVRFAPSARGMYRALVSVTVRWESGRTEQQYVQVTAAARNLDEAPAKAHENEAPSKRPAFDAADTAKMHTLRESDEFRITTQETRDAAASLADGLRRGVARARTAVFSAQDKKSETLVDRIFAALADLAVVMGVGAVVQVASKVLAPALVSAVSSASRGEVASAKLTDGVAAAMRDGMKNGISRATKSHSNAGISDDKVAFFERQTAMLDATIGLNREWITAEERRYLPALGSHSGAVIAIFQALTKSMKAASGEAEDVQGRETMAQWASGLAKRAASTTPLLLREEGAAQAHRGSEDFGVTTRFATDWMDRKGVLQLRLRMRGSGLDLETLVLEQASVKGIEKQGVEIMQGTPLRNLKIPMVIVVSSHAGTAIISRDEAGRVMARGTLPGQDGEPGASAIQLHRDAEQICNAVLGMAPTIVGDDA